MLPNPHITVLPAEDEFTRQFSRGISQLVWTSCTADLDTPVSAMLRLMEANKPCFLLESVEKGEIRGRYSVIGLMPDMIWRCTGNKAEIAYCDTMDETGFTPCAEDSLTSFRNLYEASKIEIPEGLPPMSAGLVGHMGYDMVRLMETLPDTRPDPIGIPDSCFIRPKIMVIFDAVTDKIFIVTSIWADAKRVDAQAAYAAAKGRIAYVMERLAAPVPVAAKQDFVSNTPRAVYDGMIDRAKEHIRAGDIFQVVLSQRFSAPFTLPSFSLYRALRQLNPSPFLFYLNFGAYALVGSSPEILVRLRDGEVTIRPIAGTRKRGRDREEDQLLAAELLADPKEISEHLMLLDLGRNDVGRVAKIGSVQTTQRMTIENYSHVMHIVSNVIGQIDPKYDALSALIAGFPAGTVSGAPKIRAMEIIDELETERRSFYAGCIGYFSGSGNMDTAIALRTGLVKDGTLYIQAGGGIVAESDAEAEYQESLNKARAVMRAAEEAIKFT
jgi:anthranilate synthase component 1